MREVPPWSKYFMGLAHKATERSKDPNTNVGAVLVDDNKSIIETGFNGFAPGVKENEVRWQRPTKYDYVIHAEMNAIGRAAKAGKKVDGATLYVTHFPCKECAKLIITSGVKKVIVDAGMAAMVTQKDVEFVGELFSEANVSLWYQP